MNIAYLPHLFFFISRYINEYYGMSINCIHFSSVINRSVPQDISCLAFGTSVGCISIQNVKNIFTLYPSLLSQGTTCCSLGRFTFCHSSVTSIQIYIAILK